LWASRPVMVRLHSAALISPCKSGLFSSTVPAPRARPAGSCGQSADSLLNLGCNTRGTGRRAAVPRHPCCWREDRIRAISAEAGEPPRLKLMSDQLRDAGHVANRLGVPKTWVYEAARRGLLPFVQCGRYVRFDDDDIDSWIEEQRAAEGPPKKGDPDD
jgi:excisionase family DNA binding protein